MSTLTVTLAVPPAGTSTYGFRQFGRGLKVR